MNKSLLRHLRFQVLSDLDKFVPKGQFKIGFPTSLNGKEVSKDEKWGILALTLAGRLHYEAESHTISVSPRQLVAIELLYHLGSLASIEHRNITEPDESEVINNLRTSLNEYLIYLPEQEKEPFIPLLKEDPKQLEPKNEITRGISKQQVINAFAGMHFEKDKWAKYLGDPPIWLKKCRVMTGNKSTSALWNPILIANELYGKNIPASKLNNVFRNKLKEWNAEWQDEPISYLQED